MRCPPWAQGAARGPPSTCCPEPCFVRHGVSAEQGAARIPRGCLFPSPAQAISEIGPIDIQNVMGDKCLKQSFSSGPAGWRGALRAALGRLAGLERREKGGGWGGLAACAR